MNRKDVEKGKEMLVILQADLWRRKRGTSMVFGSSQIHPAQRTHIKSSLPYAGRQHSNGRPFGLRTHLLGLLLQRSEAQALGFRPFPGDGD
ncbi:hypothetical protein SKAU_G00027610 [Synaphobranchus kaupii]|uniref:Uncharacterized protein n=1 Tax=Synaphobranchus kaupii TaxID=118154 RepID=A0A9Q1GE15_SYNKA|nr:hypothetical protein SKAU_G00027610 [Synaphobranchus kaupii]